MKMSTAEPQRPSGLPRSEPKGISPFALTIIRECRLIKNKTACCAYALGWQGIWNTVGPGWMSQPLGAT